MKKHAFYKKTISVIVSAAFLLSTFAPVIPPCNVWAESVSGNTQFVKELSAGTFTMPQELGYIKESVEIPDSTRTVIHIQDAHCNYAAQQKISEILSYLTDEYGVNAVNCEGAAKDYDLSPFTAIPEKDIRQKTSDYFVKDGMVSAAEYFAVNNPKKVNLWGVEDTGLYMKNLKVYRESLGYKAEVDRYIGSLGYALDSLKKHIYSPELLEFDGNYTKYKDGKLGFKEYLTYLMTAAGKNMINTKSFPDVYLLSQTLQGEDRIDFKRANNEKDEVVEALKRVLSKNELEELMKEVGQMKIGRISQGDFYAYLNKKAKSIKLDLKNYPELEKYIIYISIYSAVDRTRVPKELEMLEDRIKESLCKDDTQRELGTLSKNLALEKNMFNISLTRDDYMYYQKNRDGFETANFTRFIDKYAPLYKIQARPDSNAGALDGYREKMQVFYECSLERDKAFVKNIKFTDQGRPSSIIITGGFHAENLRELFKNEKVSYISIMPKFNSPAGYESPYLKRLAGQRTALENVIDTAVPAVLNLQVVEILSKELALRVEGNLNLEQFKLSVAIVAALMRGRDFVLKVTKGVPVRGAKTDEEKFITFTKGEGAGFVGSEVVSAADAPRFAALAGKENAILTAVGPDVFEFKLVPGIVPGKSTQPAESITSATKVPSSAKEPLVIKPFAAIAPDGKATVYQPAESMYDAAVKPAAGVMSGVRKDTATRILFLLASEEDKPVVSGIGQEARNLGIRINSYVAKDDWQGELKKLLEIELKNFVETDMTKFAPLMEIRIKDGADTRDTVNKMMDEILIRLGYQDKIKDIRARIRLVQVQVEPGRRTNPAVEFFADVGMLECDRYVNGDYGEDRTPPRDLQEHFITLLKLSIKNGTDFEGRNISDILNMIFSGHLLQIRPVDFRTFDQWNKANRKLMQSA